MARQFAQPPELQYASAPSFQNGLTAAEQAELDQLEAEFAQPKQQGLSIDEENELAQLEAEFGAQPVAAPVNDFKARMQNDFNQRKMQAAGVANADQSGFENAFQTLGVGAGVIGDTAANIIGSGARYLNDAIPDNLVKRTLVSGAKNLATDNPILQTAGAGVGMAGEALQEYPRLERNLQAAGNIAGILPVAFGTKVAGEGVVAGANMVGNAKSAILPAKAAIRGSEQISANAGKLFGEAEKLGGTLKPQITNKFIADIEALAPQTAMGKTLAGDSIFTETVGKIREFKNNPINLNSAQEIDEILGDLIDSEYSMGRVSKQGKKLIDVQSAFRKSIDSASEFDVVGGKAGFDALKQGRAEWSTAAKTRDIERIISRAEQMDNTATGIKNGFRTLSNNPSRMRGYSKETQLAIKKAAESGVISDGLRTILGSRLIAGLMGAAGGGFTGAVASQAVSASSRGLAAKMQMGKAEKVLRTIQKTPEPTSAISSRAAGMSGRIDRQEMLSRELLNPSDNVQPKQLLLPSPDKFQATMYGSPSAESIANRAMLREAQGQAPIVYGKGRVDPKLLAAPDRSQAVISPSFPIDKPSQLSRELLQESFEARKAAIGKRPDSAAVDAPNYAQNLRANLLIEKPDASKKVRGVAKPSGQKENFDMPLINMLRRGGGVRVGSKLDKELRHMGITPKSMPGLFKKGRGYQDVDKFPESEMMGFDLQTGETADNGWVNRNTILDGISDEYGFYKKSSKMGVDDDYLNNLGYGADKYNISTEGKSIEAIAGEVNDAQNYEKWMLDNLDVNDSLEQSYKKAKKLEKEWLDSRGDAWEPDTIKQITLDELDKFNQPTITAYPRGTTKQDLQKAFEAKKGNK